MAISKNKKSGDSNVMRCFTLNCENQLKPVKIHKYTEPKYSGMIFVCEKCGAFDKSGNKVNI